jgi:zinc finger CCHC domain-containing protein 8
MIGLPFTEAHVLSDALRIKRPRQECFNCLSSSHGVRECPIRIDEERIAIHRKIFNSQSAMSMDHMNLNSTRYTSDNDSKLNRGMIPGKISDPLKEALGITDKQLPPFIYLMRVYGYPIGWLLEARTEEDESLAVLNGDKQMEKKSEAHVEVEVEETPDIQIIEDDSKN